MTQRIGNQYLTPVGTETVAVAGQSDKPSIALLDNGGYMLFWQDLYDGYSSGIAAQVFDADGNAVGDEIAVNTEIFSIQRDVHVTTLANGNVIAVWQSMANGYTISAQLFDGNGVKIGGEFVASNVSTIEQRNPEVLALSNGNFAVAWREASASNAFSTAVQIFDSAGNKIGMPTKVGATSSVSIGNIGMSELDNGDFIVTWHGPDEWYVLGQRFDSSGAAIGSEFAVSTDTQNQENPFVSTLSDGKFVISWEHDADVVAKIYNADGTVYKSEFTVNTGTYLSQKNPHIVSLDDGGFIVFYASEGAFDITGAAGWAIAGQRYDAEGDVIGNEFIVNTFYSKHDNTNDTNFNLDAKLQEDGNILVSWSVHSLENSSGKIVTQVLDPSGALHPATQYLGNEEAVPLGDEILVNTITHERQENPLITTLENGNIVVGWSNGGGLYNPYVQIFTPEGVKVGGDILLSQATSQTGSKTGVLIEGLEGGGFVTFWAQSNAIGGRVFDADGDPVGSEFSLPRLMQMIVEPLSNGGFSVIAYGRDGQPDEGLYRLNYDATGTAVGSPAYYAYDAFAGPSPEYTLLDNGYLAVAWKTGFSINQSIFARIYDTSGNLVASDFQVDTTSVADSVSDVTALSSGNFLVTWLANSSYAVMGRLYDSAGQALSGEFAVSADVGAPAKSGTKAIATEDGGFIVAWFDSGSEDFVQGDSHALYAKRFDADGDVIGGGEFLVNTYSEITPNNYLNMTLMEDDRFAITWASNSHIDDRNQTNTSLQIFNIGDRAANLPITGTPLADHIVNGLGRDSIDGAAGNDTIEGGRSNDTLIGGLGADVLEGGDGADIYRISDRSHSTASSTDIILDFGQGSDKIDLTGLGFSDLVAGQANAEGTALAWWHQSGDTFIGNEDGSFLLRLDGEFTLTRDDFTGIGPGYALTHVGTPGNDSLVGSSGDDVFDGGKGQDVMRGHGGSDIYFYDHLEDSKDTSPDTILNWDNSDVIDVSYLGFTGIQAGSANGSTLGWAVVGNYTEIFDSGKFLIRIHNGTALETPALTADNFIFSSGPGFTDETYTGTSGADTYTTGLGNDVLNGNDGNDILTGGDGHDTIDGGAGNDMLYGGKGDDTLFGQGGYDTIDGGAGHDRLTAGVNQDWLVGGSGNDAFSFFSDTHSSETQPDTIADFVQGEDIIDLSTLTYTGIQSGAASGTVLGYTHQQNASSQDITVIEADAGTFEIIVMGHVNLTNADFAF